MCICLHATTLGVPDCDKPPGGGGVGTLIFSYIGRFGPFFFFFGGGGFKILNLIFLGFSEK